MVRLYELPAEQVFVIEKIRQINTKYGLRVVLDMEDRKCFFVPDDTNVWLLRNPAQLKKMEKLADERKIGFTRVGGMSVSFLDLSEQGIKDDDEAVKRNLAEMIQFEAEEGEEEEDEEEETEDDV